MEETQQVAPPKFQIAEYNVTASAMAELRSRVEKTVYEVSTKSGMAAALKDRAEVRGLRIALEKKRVEIKAPALERARLIDAEAKTLTAELESLEKPIDAQIKAEESRIEAEKQARILAEQNRVKAIMDRIDAILAVAHLAIGKPSDAIAAQIVDVQFVRVVKP